MYLLIGTSFFIYEVFGSFGAFHILAIVSGVTLTLGLYFPPQWPFWVGALAFWGLPFLIGTLLIYRQRKRLLERYAGHVS
jgi:hypothetical protein